MIDVLIYLGAILLCILPNFSKTISFVDILPIVFLYFDATFIFVRHEPTYQYFESAIIIFYCLKKISQYYQNIKSFNVFAYIILCLLFFPIFQGEEVEPTIRKLAVSISSLIILPISYFHYSVKGDMKNLLNSTYYFLIFFVIYVLISTPLKLGGLESERIGGTTFYYGNIASRGGITYVSFVLLMIPLMLTNTSVLKQVIIISCSILIILFFLTALKRFVFVILLLGILNYFLRPIIKPKIKLRVIFVVVAILVVGLNQSFITNEIKNRFEQRGGSSKFSQESIQSDLRIFEPFYIVSNFMNQSITTFILGNAKYRTLDLKHNNEIIEERKIHNSYAITLINSGIIGLILYLTIYFKFYNFIRDIYKKLKLKFKDKNIHYWIAFQNLVLIFLVQGMVGGHDRVSLRGLVFLYAGAIGGHLTYKFNQNKIASK